MPPAITLLFGVHNHQPVGNFPGIFNRANYNCYRPFIETLLKFPQIKATLHFSGSLIDWLLKNDPGLLQRLKEMLKRGQVEILTGGYYEPILPVIPERDRIGQIKMLSDFIKDYFQSQPQGLWIGERVWEPGLVKSLVRAGIKYILLDDFHFLYAGLKEKDLQGYYLTEEETEAIAVFPISKKLRYIIPFSQPAQPIAYLKSLASKEADKALTIVDDGEKFGLWPGTHKWVYRERWLEKFFQLLLKNQDWLNTETISEYMHRVKPLGKVHLPAASYEEMMTWSGGDFNNFFSKYPEANNLRKRMVYVSEKLHKEKGDNQEAKSLLYQGQCNCPYWHGVFGGIYLRHLRSAAYRHLIKAQSLLEKGRQTTWLKIEGFDHDEKDELIIENPFLNVFVAPKLGGGIFELDYLPKNANLMDTMTRRPEAYHKNIKPNFKKPFSLRKKKVLSIHDLLISKERQLADCLIYDSYRRLSLLEHFFSPTLSFQDFKSARYQELGDFVNGEYQVRQEQQAQGLCLILERRGSVDYQDKKVPLRLNKKLFLNNKDAQVAVEYNLENLSAAPLDIVFAVEFNISLENPSLKEDLQAKDMENLKLQDPTAGIEATFYFEKRADLWSYPLETISASEEGFERNYQQTVILPCWPLRLEEAWQTKITVAVSG